MKLPERRRDLPEPQKWFRLIGPGAIMVATSIGSGEMYFWPHLSVNVGAWVLLLGVAAVWMQYIMNTEISRYTLATGETVLMGFNRLWKPLPFVILVCCTLPWVWPGWAMGGAVAASWLIGGTPTILGVASLLLAGVLLSLGKRLYTSLEVSQKLMIGTAIVAALVMFVLTRAHLAVPGLVVSLSSQGVARLGDIDLLVLMTALAFCGAGGTINLTQSNYVKEKGFGMAALVPRLENPLAGRKSSLARPAGASTTATEDVAPREGYTWEPTQQNCARWVAWWREMRTEQFVNFFIIGSLGLLLISLVAIRLVGSEKPVAGMGLLRQEMNSASLIWQPSGSVFAILVFLVFFTSEVGVLDHVCRLVANIASCKGLVDPRVRWRTEGAFYLYALWLMIVGGVVILLGLNIQAPPRLLVTAGSLSLVAMLIYTVAVLFLHRAARRQWVRAFPNGAKSLNPFAVPLWRTAVLFGACLLFGAFSAVAIVRILVG